MIQFIAILLAWPLAASAAPGAAASQKSVASGSRAALAGLPPLIPMPLLMGTANYTNPSVSCRVEQLSGVAPAAGDAALRLWQQQQQQQHHQACARHTLSFVAVLYT
jgi:hypothetical protein